MKNYFGAELFYISSLLASFSFPVTLKTISTANLYSCKIRHSPVTKKLSLKKKNSLLTIPPFLEAFGLGNNFLLRSWKVPFYFHDRSLRPAGIAAFETFVADSALRTWEATILHQLPPLKPSDRHSDGLFRIFLMVLWWQPCTAWACGSQFNQHWSQFRHCLLCNCTRIANLEHSRLDFKQHALV